MTKNMTDIFINRETKNDMKRKNEICLRVTDVTALHFSTALLPP
jgi:hypothetical protein